MLRKNKAKLWEELIKWKSSWRSENYELKLISNLAHFRSCFTIY